MKKWAHAEMIIDGAKVYDLMEFCEGKIIAGSLKVRPVRHGGDTEEGTPRARPSAREFALTYAQSFKQWKISEAIDEAEKLGFSKASIYAMTNTLMNEKIFKRVGPATYALAAKATRTAKAPKRARPISAPIKSAPVKGGRKTSKRIKPPGTTMIDKVFEALKATQNGSGEGVDIADIRKAMKTEKRINPYLRDLVAEKQITRVAPGKYRAIAQ